MKNWVKSVKKWNLDSKCCIIQRFFKKTPILITELKKIRSCAKCIGKPTLIMENEISNMFKNLDKSEESVDTVDETKTRIANNTVAFFY